MAGNRSNFSVFDVNKFAMLSAFNIQNAIMLSKMFNQALLFYAKLILRVISCLCDKEAMSVFTG